jgi:hypothetical protein
VPPMLSGTIRANIMMGVPLNEQRYRAVLDGCCLTPDIRVNVCTCVL